MADMLHVLGTSVVYVGVLVLSGWIISETEVTLSPFYTFCGTNNTIRSFNISGPFLLVSFLTNNHNVSTGFQLKYEAIEAPVTTTSMTTSPSATSAPMLIATSSFRYLHSPNYPQDYPSFAFYTWVIKADTAGYMVRLTVLDLQLESTGTCQFDSVEVFDGVYAGSTQSSFGKWCGELIRPTVQSSGRYLTVHFKSDGSRQYSGFRMIYRQTRETHTCGANLTVSATPKYFFSPGYYGNYPKNTDCVWTIRTTFETTKIKIQLLKTDIEHSSNCQYDYLKILDGSSSASRELGRVCGTQTPSFVSSGRDVRIKFHSDSSSQGGGFKLMYTGGYFEACSSENLDAYTHTRYISSPGYPNSYPNNVNCDWSIDTGDSDYVVTIETVESELEYAFSCGLDYVEAFDGLGPWSDSLGRWCGTQRPTKHSSGRFMYIKFHTDGSSTRGGFKIAYRAELKSNFYSINVGAIIGGIMGIIVFFVICACCIGCARRRKPNTIQRRSTNARMVNNHTASPPQQNVFFIPGSSSPTSTDVYPHFNPASFAPPPAYSEVIKDSPAGWEAPPSYESVQDIQGELGGMSGRENVGATHGEHGGVSGRESVGATQGEHGGVAGRESVSRNNDGDQDNLGYESTYL